MEDKLPSRKRKSDNETIAEALAKEQREAKDERNIAKGNIRDLRIEASRLKNEYATIRAEYNELLEYSGVEPPNLKVDLDKAKEDMDRADAELVAEKTALENLSQDREEMVVENDTDKEQDIITNIAIVKGDRAALQDQLTKSKTTYQNVLAKYENTKEPALKAEAEKRKANIDVMDAEALEVDGELQRLKSELKEVRKTGRGGLFVPHGHLPVPPFPGSASHPIDFTRSEPPVSPFDFKPRVPPSIGVTGADGETIEDDPEDLWSPAMARRMAGLKPDNFRIEGWKGGQAKILVIGRGPPNASSFRLERGHAVHAVLEERVVPDITLNRFGEMKYNKKFMYGKHNMPVVQAVAWLVGDDEDPLELLRPPPAGAPKTKRIDLAIKIKWYIGNEYHKSWETRSTIRRLWGYTQGNVAIYEAAKFQEKRYAEWQSGERASLDRSPTPGPQIRQSPTPSPPPAPGLGLPGVEKEPEIKKEKPEKSAMSQYKAIWCESNEVDASDMEEEDEARFLSAWQNRIR